MDTIGKKLSDIWPRNVPNVKVTSFGLLAHQKRAIFTPLQWLLSRYAPLLQTTLLLDTSSRYKQVLTGVLPYHGSNVKEMIADIRAGKRPSRPRDPNQNRWLQRRVWGVITTGWSHKPEKRQELSDMHRVFSTSTQREQGNSNSPNAGDRMKAEIPQTPNSATGTREEDHIVLPVSTRCGARNPEAC